MSKRMTRGEFQESLGAFNPVGHSVLAFADDKTAGEAAQAARDAGFGADDVIVYTSADSVLQIAAHEAVVPRAELYAACDAARRIMSVSLGVGSRLPAHCTSLGRALLSALPESRLEAFLAQLQPAPLAEHTRGAVQAARTAGYALVNEELEPGLRSVAMPVRDMRGRCVAATNIGAHAGRATDAVVEGLFLPALRRAVARLKERIPG